MQPINNRPVDTTSSSTLHDSESSLLLGANPAMAALHREKDWTGAPLNVTRGAPVDGRVWWCLLIAVPVFFGYGTLLKLQSHLRSHLHISTLRDPPPGFVASNSPSAYLFGFCVSCYYVGLMLFRVGHNVFFGYKLRLVPRHRVLLGYGIMAAALGLLAVLYYAIFPDKSVGLTDTAADVAAHHEAMIGVLVCYFLGGVAVSTFEPNMLSSLTPLGSKNKSLAAIGIPIGNNSIAMVVLFLLGNMETYSSVIEVASYLFAAFACILGAVNFAIKVPAIEFEASGDDAAAFLASMKQFRCWLPKMAVPMAASACDEFCLAMAVSIGQYIYGDATLPLLYPFVARDAARQVWVSHDHFLIAYFFFGFVGGVLSRHYTFFWRRRSPLVYLLLSLLSIGLILSKIPLLAPLGMFSIMFGNGAIYATVVRFVDEELPLQYNLVALSVWMCIGDVGGFCGANAVVPVHASLGTV